MPIAIYNPKPFGFPSSVTFWFPDKPEFVLAEGSNKLTDDQFKSVQESVYGEAIRVDTSAESKTVTPTGKVDLDSLSIEDAIAEVKKASDRETLQAMLLNEQQGRKRKTVLVAINEKLGLNEPLGA